MPTRLRDLGAPARLAVFAAALALVGGVAALAGAATGHGRVAPKAHGSDEGMAMDTSVAAQSRASGLATEAAGYTLVPSARRFRSRSRASSGSASSTPAATRFASSISTAACACT